MSLNDFLKKPPYSFGVDDPAFVPKYRASCYCGKVQYEISEEPLDGTFCHCTVCQRLHGNIRSTQIVTFNFFMITLPIMLM